MRSLLWVIFAWILFEKWWTETQVCLVFHLLLYLSCNSSKMSLQTKKLPPSAHPELCSSVDSWRCRAFQVQPQSLLWGWGDGSLGKSPVPHIPWSLSQYYLASGKILSLPRKPFLALPEARYTCSFTPVSGPCAFKRQHPMSDSINSELSNKIFCVFSVLYRKWVKWWRYFH